MPMSDSPRFNTRLDDPLTARVQALELAWEQCRHGGSPPRWQDYLPPPGEPASAAFLFWVLATDVECRIAAGLPALLAEPYFQDDRLRGAAGDGELLLELVRREYQLGWATGQRPRRQDYLERFPHLPEIGALCPIVRCRSCSHEATLADEDAPGMDCPRCGCRITPSVTPPSTRPPAPAGSMDLHTSFLWSGVPAPAPPDAAPTWSRRLGRYELGEELAHGGMGVVLLAHDPALDRELVVKVLKSNLRHRPDLVRRFVEEAQITAQLPHPGIVPVHELGVDDLGLPFLAMKLVRGQDLGQLFAQRSSPADDLPRFVGIFEQVCQAMAFAHSRRVIHRDLKPGNIMVGRFGEVQVMDWGLAKRLDHLPTPQEKAAGQATAGVSHPVPIEPAGHVRSSSAHAATETGTVLGTLAYMPPEQAAGQIDRIDERCDVFGLGAILCEVLTGKPPYVATQHSQLVSMAARGELTEALRRLDACGADGELVTLAKDCLSAGPEDRPRDGGVVSQRVAAYQRGVQERLRQAEQERAASQARQAEERKRRVLLMALAAVVGLLLLAGGSAAWQLHQQRARQQESGQKALQVLARARSLLEAGWEANDLASLHAAQVEADRAVEVATSGAAPVGVQEETGAVQREAQERLDRAEKDRSLLQDLLNIWAPQETGTYQRDASGHAIILEQPSVDEQYAAAFRRRWPDLDIDRTEEAEVVARLSAEPRPVVEEVVAALDAWLLHRRQAQQPEAAWQRLLWLAEELDRNGQRRQLRALLAGVSPPPVGIVAGLGGTALPWTALWQVDQGERWRRMVELRRQVNAAREPASSVVLLARGCSAVGDIVGAEGLLRQAVTVRPSEVVVLDALARLLEKQGKLAEAIQYFQAARARGPELGVALAQALSKAGRAEEGLAVLRDLADKHPDNPERHFSLGLALYGQEKVSEAEAAYRKAIALKPGDPIALNNLGATLRAQKRPQEAEPAYRKAIELKPGYAEAHMGLGNALYEQKKVPEAEAAYRKAIQFKPDFYEAYNNLGITLDAQKKRSQAAEAYHRALKLKPDYSEASYNLGVTLRADGKPGEAEAAYRRAIALRPDFPQALVGLGNALRDQKKNVSEAEAAYRKAITLKPDFADAHNGLGNALYDQKRLSEAETAYRKAIAIKPGDALAYNNLGNVLRDRKELEAAVKAFRKADELLPNHPVIRNALLYVERLLQLDGKLAACLAGTGRPKGPREAADIAACAIYREKYRAAVRLFADAFKEDPKLADDLDEGDRYNAACAAVLAAAGQGKDATGLGEPERATLRREGLDWLAADLKLSSAILDKNRAAAPGIRERMANWLDDTDLASVRDPAALAKLPEAERDGWKRLWADVEALQKRCQGK
jgi:tetratricopeptide (TPR) repeat protein